MRPGLKNWVLADMAISRMYVLYMYKYSVSCFYMTLFIGLNKNWTFCKTSLIRAFVIFAFIPESIMSWIKKNKKQTKHNSRENLKCKMSV